MEKFRCTQRDRLHYYNPERKIQGPENPWLLIPFINQWFNLIDLCKIRSQVEHLNPYQTLEVRWLYPEPPQKLSQSVYKATLDEVDFDLWINTIIPRFDELTQECHCQNEHKNEPRCQGHLASGNLDSMISNPIILDRLKRGPMFRETTNGDLTLARQALNGALRDLFDRNKKPQANVWIDKFLRTFDEQAQILLDQTKRGEIDLQKLLFPAPGNIKEHQKELDAILEKYVILPADKCKGNYLIVCKNLYIRQCVVALHQAPEYNKLNMSKDELSANLLQQITGILHHSHLALMLEKGKTELPYFYTLPKPHKNPIGWRPVAATHRSMFAIPQRVLTQALGLVMKALKEFHAKEFKDTGLRKYWIVENSLEIILSLPETVTSMYSSNIDSMYQKMNQNNVIESTSEEIRRATAIIQADAFFIVVGDTSLGNTIDQVFWYNSESGLDPMDQSISSTKDKCSKGVVYPVQNIINILIFLVQNSYVTLGNSVHHQINGIPHGGHSSGFLANLTCHNDKRKWVDKYPFHSLQYCISRYMDDFGIINADYFQDMYRDIYPEETGIRLIPNKVRLKQGRLVECKLLDTLIFVDSDGVVHVTLYDKREDYEFFANRFPDIDSNACRFQSISSFYGEIVRLFRLSTHREGFFENVSEVAAYSVKYKRYPENELPAAFSRFLDTQVFGYPRLMGVKQNLITMFRYKLDRKLNR
jgi:hypothetical protein